MDTWEVLLPNLSRISKNTIVTEIEELKINLGEIQGEIKVYKEKAALVIPQTEKTDAEIAAFQSKIELLEQSLEDKRKDTETIVATTKLLELKKRIRSLYLESLEEDKEQEDIEKDMDWVVDITKRTLGE